MTVVMNCSDVLIKNLIIVLFCLSIGLPALEEQAAMRKGIYLQDAGMIWK